MSDDKDSADEALRARWGSSEDAAADADVNDLNTAKRIAELDARGLSAPIATRVHAAPTRATRRKRERKPDAPASGPTFPVLIALGASTLIGSLVGTLTAFPIGVGAPIIRGLLYAFGGFALAIGLIPLRRCATATLSQFSFVGYIGVAVVVAVAFAVRAALFGLDLSLWDLLWLTIQLGLVFGGLQQGLKMTYDATSDIHG